MKTAKDFGGRVDVGERRKEKAEMARNEDE